MELLNGISLKWRYRSYNSVPYSEKLPIILNFLAAGNFLVFLQFVKPFWSGKKDEEPYRTEN